MKRFENFITQFARGWKAPKGTKFFGKQIIVPLDAKNERTAVLTFEDRGTRDHFNGFDVKIVNNLTGQTANQFFFTFREHMNMNHPRPDQYFHVWNDRELNWYISRPNSGAEADFLKKIFEYVSMFVPKA